jgi:hypothetical protein
LGKNKSVPHFSAFRRWKSSKNHRTSWKKANIGIYYFIQNLVNCQVLETWGMTVLSGKAFRSMPWRLGKQDLQSHNNEQRNQDQTD